MPTVTFGPEFNSNPVSVFNYLDLLPSEADDIEDETLPDNQALIS